MDKTTTRSTLSEAVFKNVRLSRNESANLVDSVFSEILGSLINGDDVKISSFGTFIVRQKKERIGRNPKTGEEVPITARSVVTFRASNVLKSKVNTKNNYSNVFRGGKVLEAQLFCEFPKLGIPARPPQNNLISIKKKQLNQI